MSTSYEKGRQVEYKVMKMLGNLGWCCVRSAGSHSMWDVIAVKATEVKFIQVKSTSSESAGYGGEIERIELFDVPYNCSKELWVYRFRTKPHWAITIIKRGTKTYKFKVETHQLRRNMYNKGADRYLGGPRSRRYNPLLKNARERGKCKFCYADFKDPLDTGICKECMSGGRDAKTNI